MFILICGEERYKSILYNHNYLGANERKVTTKQNAPYTLQSTINTSMFSSLMTLNCNFYQYIFELDTIFTNQFPILAL